MNRAHEHRRCTSACCARCATAAARSAAPNAGRTSAGVHRNLLYALLDCPKVHRVVYVCSGPESVVRDVLHLVTPARSAKRRHQAEHKGNVKATAPTRYRPFRPLKTVPLDMSPHTAHVEMIVLLER